MHQFHPAAISQEQMADFIMLSERPRVYDVLTPCPFCPDVRSLVELEAHMAEHLESIALFVLDSNTEETADDKDVSDDISRIAGSEATSRLLSDSSGFVVGSQKAPSLVHDLEFVQTDSVDVERDTQGNPPAQTEKVIDGQAPTRAKVRLSKPLRPFHRSNPKYEKNDEVQMEITDPQTHRKTFGIFAIRGEPRKNKSTNIGFWEYQLDYVRNNVRYPYKGDTWFPEGRLNFV